MKKFFLSYFLSLFFLGFSGGIVGAQNDSIMKCPIAGKSCAIRGNSLKTLRDETLLKCKHGSNLITIFKSKELEGSTEKEKTLQNIVPIFNSSVGQILLAAEKCSKSRYKKASENFNAVILQAKNGILDEINRLNTEGKTEEALFIKNKIEANSTIYRDILGDIKLEKNLSAIPSSESIFSSGDGKILGYETKLKDYTDGKTSGTEQFRSSIEKVIDFLKQMMIPIAIFLVVFSGMELISMRGSGAEETATKKKSMIISILGGFFIFFLAINAVDWVLFGTQGQILRGDGVDASVDFAKRGFSEFEGLYNYLSTIIVIIAVLFIVITAFRLVFSGGDESMQENAKKQILYTVIGIIVIITLKPLLKIFTSRGKFSIPSETPVIELFLKWADFILGFLGILAVVALIYGGIRMVLHFGNEEAESEAKKTIQYALIGLVIAFSTWTIINFFANPSGTGIDTAF